MQGKIHDKDNKHHTFPWGGLLCKPIIGQYGAGNPERNDEKFWRTGGRP